jgi:hypothetical protein
MEMIEMRGLPSGVKSSRCASSGSPESQVANPGRCDECIQSHGELEPVLRGKERLEIEGPQLFERWLLHRLDETAHVERQSLAPLAFDDVGEQNVFSRADGVGLDAEQTEQSGHHGSHAVAQRAGIG